MGVDNNQSVEALNRNKKAKNGGILPFCFLLTFLPILGLGLGLVLVLGLIIPALPESPVDYSY
jgi:hypothetical protein